MEEEPHLSPPEMLPEDLIVTQGLGTGGFSCVIKVEHGEGSGRFFALKCISKKTSTKTDRLRRELAVLTKGTPSPFLIRCNLAFESPTAVFFAMELLGGGDLFTAITHLGCGDGFSEEQTRTIAAEVILGLIHLHRRDSSTARSR